MVAMRVGDEDVRDRLVADRIEDRLRVRLVVGAGVDDRDLSASDDVGDGAGEGERAGIVGDDPADAWRNLFDLIGWKVEALVEGDVVAHGEYAGTALL